MSRWIPVSERLPDNTDPVNITWVNHDPVSYYADIKNKPFAATGHYCNGRWWWYSVACQDYLDEYGHCDVDAMDDAIEVIAWMPLPEPMKEGISNTADDEAQAIDAEPVKHGRWEAGVTCSKCGFIRQITRNGNLMVGRYCPNCGAKMDLKDGESK